MSEITSMPVFGVLLTICAFEIGRLVQRRLKSQLANPLLIGIILCIGFLKIFHISVDDYNKGGAVVSLFLAPATVCLAISAYKQMQVLKENFIPVIIGTTVGSLFSVGSVILLCKFFQLDNVITASLLPKSVTTAIAIEISTSLGGMSSITVAAVVATGILGAILAPVLIRLMKIKEPVVSGVAIGTSSHAVGTSKAIEMGEVEGAVSGISLIMSGIITVVLTLFM